VRAWGEAVSLQLDKALRVLEGRSFDHPPDAERVRRLLDRREALLRFARGLADAGNGTLMTRIHGDLHLGQVLVTGGDATIIDFEGEPTRSLSERRSKNSPLRDVAGVLRSFDYAAAAAERGMTAEPRSAERRAANLLLRFRQMSRRAFLEGYAEAGGDTSNPLLDLFLIEKAAYEVCYEASSRPAWLEIPMHGLSAIVDRLMPAPAGTEPWL
jgi:maltose alpha-D-glucosyltransferase/alpha-amylase